MSLDPEDVRALDERTEAACRAAVAGSLRMQAMTLRSQADLLASMARTLDAQADGIEEGREPVPVVPLRMAVVPIEPEPEPSRAPFVQAIRDGEFGNAPILVPRDDEQFTPEMMDLLDRFDDRHKMAPEFITAVNEAAEQGVLIRDPDRVAQAIADRLSELRELRAMRGLRGEEGGTDGGE